MKTKINRYSRCLSAAFTLSAKRVYQSTLNSVAAHNWPRKSTSDTMRPVRSKNKLFRRTQRGTTVCLSLFILFSPLFVLMPSADAAGETYTYNSATQIQSSGGQLGTMTFNGAGTQFVNDVTCELSQKTGASGEIQYTVTVGSKIASGGYNGTVEATVNGLNCGTPLIPANKTTAITISDRGGVGPGGGSQPGGAQSAGNTATPQWLLTCNAGWNPLNWLMCGMVSGLVNIANDLG